MDVRRSNGAAALVTALAAALAAVSPAAAGGYAETVVLRAEAPTVTLEYSVVNDWILCQATLDATAWLAVGVSTDGKMIGKPKSNAVVAKPSLAGAAQVGYYHLDGLGVQYIDRVDTDRVQNMEVEQSGGKTVLRFERNIDTKDGTAQIAGGGTTNVIFAFGKNNTFAHHLHAGGQPIKFAMDHSVTLRSDQPSVVLQYDVLEGGFLKARATLNDTAWLGIGVSATGMMIGKDGKPMTNAVVGMPALTGTDRARYYHVEGTCVACIKHNANANVHNMSIEQAHGYTVLNFVRKLDTGDATAQISTTKPTAIIFGSGKNNTFDHHKHAGGASINFGAAPKPDSGGSVKFDDHYSMTWSVKDGEISVQATLDHVGWAGIALAAPAGTMLSTTGPPSDAFVARFDVGPHPTMAEYQLVATTPAGVQSISDSTFTDASVTTAGGKTVFTFTRKMDTGNSKLRAFPASGATTVLWAYGKSTTFVEHVARGSVQIDFSTGGNAAQPIPLVRILHGSAMALAFAVFFPSAVLTARYKKDTRPTTGPDAFWFKWHVRLNVTGTLIGLVGFCIACYMCWNNPLATTHSKVGLALFGVTICLPMAGFMRPNKDAKYRGVFEILHKNGGRLVVFGAIPTIILGLRALLPAGKTLNILTYAYGAVAAIMVLTFVVNEYWLRSKRQAAYGDRIKSSEVPSYSYKPMMDNA